MLGIIVLQNKEWIAARSLEIVCAYIAIADGFFAKHADLLAWFAPHGGSVAFPRWLGSQPVERFCQDLLDQQGVMPVPGSLFVDPGSHFRLGLGRRNFGEALARLDDYLLNC